MKKTHFVGSSKDDLSEFPDSVKLEIGFAIYLAQSGVKALDVVPLVGFGNASTLEVISDNDGDTYRAVYTVRFKRAVYVLHAFKKKSVSGISTPQKEIDLVKRRLKQAEAHYEKHYGKDVRHTNVKPKER